MKALALLPLLILAAMAAPAQAGAEDKFSVEGNTLFYDTNAPSQSDSQEIEQDDIAVMTRYLRDTPGIRTLKLNSTGGSVWAGNEMARIVIDFELNTVVDGECSSSCVTVFLAGRSRQMTRGSKMGFHQRSWSSGAIASYYERWHEEEGWADPFEFASWVYQDTQTETFKDLTYMISRGVDPEFAIETKRLRSGTWFPSRHELVQGGVLTE